MSNEAAVADEVWTIRRVTGWATDDLKKRGMSSPRLEVELLLGRVLRLDRVGLLIDGKLRFLSGDATLPYAAELVAREGELREGVGAVDDHGDPSLAGHVDDLADREDLPGDVDDVAHVDQAGLRRDLVGEQPDHDLVVLDRDRQPELLEHDLVPPLALLPGGDHPRIIVGRGQDLVARLEVEAELTDLQPLRGVADDRDLLAVAAEVARELILAGRHPETPVMIAVNVSLPSERLIHGKLSALAFLVQTISDDDPTLLLIGEAVQVGATTVLRPVQVVAAC